MSNTEKNNTEKLIDLKDFLELIPPGQYKEIKVYESRNPAGYTNYFNELPEIYIYCRNEKCLGERYFTPDIDRIWFEKKIKNHFIVYTCRNCKSQKKYYSMISSMEDDNKNVGINKIGEIPFFGTPTPPKLIELIGPDKDYFLMGRRCENQGLGIGAFTYYRRVVENQKNRIFDKIINVAKKISSNTDTIKDLENAKKETQFTKGVEIVKHALPESLMIDGHNPLTLLHKALSEGVHDKSDEECLKLANSIRVILAELAQRAAQILKDDAVVSSALSNLLNRKKQ